jgi:uncharacterized repeat protein (TIGR03803 family)
LATLNSASGENPYTAGLVMDSSGSLYGTAENGGGNGYGTVFELPQLGLTSTSVTSSNGTSVYGQPVTFTATVTSASGSGETGTVRFQIDGSGVGSPMTLSGNTATYNTSSLSVGSHSIVAIYSGDATFAASTSPIYTQKTAMGTNTVVTSNNDSPVYGQSVIFTATVTPASGSGETGTVQFKIDGNNAGNPVGLSGNTAAYTTSTLTAGSHSVVAVYSGDSSYTGSTSTALTQVVSPAPLALAAIATYVKLAADGQHVDAWNNSTGSGTPNQSLPCCDVCGITYAGPAGGDLVVIDYSNGDPLPAGGISLTGGAGQNTLEIVGDPAGASDTIAIKGGSFTIPAGTPGAGTVNYTLGTISIAAGASLALAQSDSQADQTVLAVNNLSAVGTLDIGNNTLLANENNVPVSQVTTWVQNAGVGASIFSSLVTGPDSQASRAVGYGDWNEDPLSVPAGDVEVKYVPVGDTNLDGYVDITDVARAINNLGQSPGYYGGDVLNQGMVNITDIAAIVNDLGGSLTSSGDSAAVQPAAGEASGAMIPVTPAGAAVPISATGRRPAHTAVSLPPAGTSIPSLFSDSRIQGDWMESNIPILDD